MNKFHFFDHCTIDHKRIRIGYTHGAIQAVDGKGNRKPRIENLVKIRGDVRVKVDFAPEVRLH